jgi:hydroxymethylglutaryl-CoA reductase (NADPH)
MTSLSRMDLKERQKFLVQKAKVKLHHISQASFAADEVTGHNCENVIGCTQVPLGVAGPIRIKNQSASRRTRIKEYYLPLATTEGALVASVNRGCKATFTGGIQVAVEDVGVTRGPVFRVAGIRQGQRAVKAVKDYWERLQKLAHTAESHLNLKDFSWALIGKNLYLRFQFTTGEAMGMNMATVATEKMAEFLCRKLGISLVSLSGNYCIDKKPAWLTAIAGRGKRVWAETVIDKHEVAKVLRTTPEKIIEVVKRKIWLGSAAAGSLGFNAHYANIVAALYLACGQDIAHVVEGSLGITTAELEDNGNLYFSVFLPSILVGTVGGGTQLPTQKEALQLLGLGEVHSGDALGLAAIVGAAVLAGELSLTAALAGNQLAAAHQIWGRGKHD